MKEKVSFKSSSPTLQILIGQMIQRAEEKFDELGVEETVGDLKRFASGEIQYTSEEMSSKLSRVLRLLSDKED
jgi:hypothetical protein